jgi:hypothetical protein
MLKIGGIHHICSLLNLNTVNLELFCNVLKNLFATKVLDEVTNNFNYQQYILRTL